MKLYLISTPIGNLDDLSERAKKTLQEVDLVLAEDTRKTGLLLKNLGLDKKLLSFHEHNEQFRLTEVLNHLKSGKSVALVSDAGTPTISDPGFKLVRATIQQGFKVIPIPGPSAVLAALTASGLPTDHFLFIGYLPKTSGKAEKILESLRTFSLPTTIVLYESPHRIGKTLDLLDKYFPEANLVIAREMTKIHEEFLRGDVREIKEEFGSTKFKGELTLVLRQ